MIVSLDSQGFGNYTISDNGVVRNKMTGDIVSTFMEQDGYLRVRMKDNFGTVKKRYVHRLLAIMFLDNPNCYEYVGHVNENKTDNRIENLFWYEKRHK